MTAVNGRDAKMNKKETRIRRRTILKAGAVAAPLAMTLYGGIPLAHAESSGGCAEELEKHKRIPHFDLNGDQDGDVAFDPYSFTGRTNSDGSSETHWDYLINVENTGGSCLQSIQDAGHKFEHHPDPDHPSHGGS